MVKRNISHGNGKFRLKDFRRIGKNVVFEAGVLVFHPENIEIGNNVYVGHYTILKGYHKNTMIIGDETWIGQQCFFHSAGGLHIGREVGIGPKVTILTSEHQTFNKNSPVYFAPIELSKMELGDDCDIGAGAILIPNAKIGRGAIIGAGAVVNKDVAPFEIWAGVPARKIGLR